MHESALHFFNPRREALPFVNIVSGNKEGFTQKEIKGAEVAKSLEFCTPRLAPVMEGFQVADS
jgi:hypothetical protein